VTLYVGGGWRGGGGSGGVGGDGAGVEIVAAEALAVTAPRGLSLSGGGKVGTSVTSGEGDMSLTALGVGAGPGR